LHNLDYIYDSFVQKMAVHSRSQQLSSAFIEIKIAKLRTDYSLLFDDKSKYDTPISMNTLSFYSWKECKIVHYSKQDITLNTLLHDIVRHQNKQYQWHLVSAFEDYEKCLKDIYAYCVCLQSKSELYNASLPTIYKVAYELIYSNLRNENAAGLLSKLRKLLPKYRELEIKNDRKDNMRFVLSFIHSLRNIIVHNEGVTDDREKLLTKLLKECGIKSDCDEGKLCINYFNMCFTSKENPNEITLLEIPILDFGFMKASTDVLGNLFQALLNSVYHLCNGIKEKYNGGRLN